MNGVPGSFLPGLQPALPHLMLVPVLLPLLAAAVMLLLGERRRQASALLNVAVCTINLAVAVALLLWVNGGATTSGAVGGQVGQASAAAIGVYLPGNWTVPFGIVLVADRLTALMLLLVAIVALAALLFAAARWGRAGVFFHPLFMLQVMGLNGAFLTADLFNLFVFFEVLLAASYGLMLHGSGRARVGAGLHYVAVNLCASFLFLLAIALIYRSTGSLGMADIAARIAQLSAAERPLLQAGAALLAVAFLTKAAIWPLNFWLAPAYSAASSPVAGLFVLLSKVGIYAVLRLWSLWFPSSESAAASAAPFGAPVLVWAGLATMTFGTLGTLASQQLARLTSFSLIVSSGTLLAAIGFAANALTASAVFYLLISTLAASALFLLSELIDRSRLIAGVDAYDEAGRAPVPRAAIDPPGVVSVDLQLDPDAQIETMQSQDELPAPIGRPIRAAMAFLGFAFIACVLLIAGLPPLAGFLSKFGLLQAVLARADVGGVGPSAAGWIFVALLALSGAAALIALSRLGIRMFWAAQKRPLPHLRKIEVAPVVGLLVVCLAVSVWPDPTLRYLNATAAALHSPAQYASAVAAARPVPPPQARTP
ncbi:MAG: monovalent cation/H+ antiporter subunit D [Burkholderiales bacterium]